MSLLLALLAAQLGPQVSPGAAPPLPHQQRTVEQAPTPTAVQSGVQPCPEPDDAEDAAEAAMTWLGKAKGVERANAGECLGVALSRLESWTEAAGAFSAARTAANTPVWRARLGAMAGEAALNGGDPAAALAALDGAKLDAAGDATMLGGIALYRARALVALGRQAEAETPLAEARAAAPNDARIWLLSATLSRRLGKLGEAQQQIQRAGELLPIDPEIGLEAGVIAVLSGRDAAARKSWESVVSAAPGSSFAETAKGYLAQLGSASAATAAPGR